MAEIATGYNPEEAMKSFPKEKTVIKPEESKNDNNSKELEYKENVSSSIDLDQQIQELTDAIKNNLAKGQNESYQLQIDEKVKKKQLIDSKIDEYEKNNKKSEPQIDLSPAANGSNPDIEVGKNITPTETVASAQEGLSQELKNKKDSENQEKPVEKTEIKNTETEIKSNEAIKNLESNIKTDKDYLESRLLSPRINQNQEIIDGLKKSISDQEKQLAEEKAKLIPNPEIKKIDDEINQRKNILEKSKDKLSEEEIKLLQNDILFLEVKKKEAQELFVEQKISPETEKNNEIINVLSIQAINPMPFGKKENELNLSLKKNDIEKIINESKTESQRALELKKYLISSLDQSINLRNELKYGKGLFGKVKKFLNEGMGGAATKIISGSLVTGLGTLGSMGLLSPLMWGIGIRTTAEGVTQLIQELRGDRKKELEKNQKQLEGNIETKIIELDQKLKNNELSPEKYSEELKKFIISEQYSGTIKTLLENDTNILKNQEKLRSKVGTYAGIAGILYGMPMDVDLEKGSHFVKWAGGMFKDGKNWLDMGRHLWSVGTLANLGLYGAGNYFTYLFNKEAISGYPKEFKFTVKTTKEQQKEINNTSAKTEPGKIGGLTKEQTLEVAEKIAKGKSQEEEKTTENKEEEKTDFNQLINELNNIKNDEEGKNKIIEIFNKQKQGSISYDLVALRMISLFEGFKLDGTQQEINNQKNALKEIISTKILNNNIIKDENKEIIRNWLIDAKIENKSIKIQKGEKLKMNDIEGEVIDITENNENKYYRIKFPNETIVFGVNPEGNLQETVSGGKLKEKGKIIEINKNINQEKKYNLKIGQKIPFTDQNKTTQYAEIISIKKGINNKIYQVSIPGEEIGDFTIINNKLVEINRSKILNPKKQNKEIRELILPNLNK